MNFEIDKILDTSGLLCPEPVMMLHKAVREVSGGAVIHVIATDPSTTRDIPKFCHFLGHELVMEDHNEKTYNYFIKKSSN